MMNKLNSRFFVMLFLFSQALSAQWLSTNEKQIVNDNGEEIILRGMGLGGWMLMEGYMLQTANFANPQHLLKEKITALIGQEATNAFFEAWLTNHVTEADIDSLKLWGFNSVRLPMHYNLFTLPIEAEPTEGENTWLEKGFELTDQLIEWCKKNEMYVILDLHAAPGGQGYDQGISDYNPNKPALWESKLNREKTVALWQRIANKYSKEPWVAGYDLINEPNWDLPGNVLLKSLYQQITEAIRAVDDRHIIFIEGNWFANDFSNLTPPWDDNMVYSPHKYWSINNEASIKWVLDIREAHKVPLYFGESGENSNVWFRDAIKLFEDNNIGWAWWPLKKVESIAGPLSITKTEAYQNLLNYWEGNAAKPSVESAKNTLMDLAGKANISECRYQKDVIDAMFRQVYTNGTQPFTMQHIPGIINATDYDMGVIGEAYYDNESANYQVSTNNYTSWNNGWIYRNDGVDIEVTENTINSNGYNVGWIASGEWMQYTVNVTETALYDVAISVASNSGDGKFYFSLGETQLTTEQTVPKTGGWQSWQTLTVPDVVLLKADQSFRFNVVDEGLNLGSFKFIKRGATSTVNTTFVAATTEGKNTIHLDVNKPLQSLLNASFNDFTIAVNGSAVQIIRIELLNNNRTIFFEVDLPFNSNDLIQITYNGTAIIAEDGTALNNFTDKEVQNTIFVIHQIPGILEAEDFFFQNGIQLETTTDVGGGKNIGYLDVGDYLDYYIEVPASANYNVAYRTAAESEQGAVELQIIEPSGSAKKLHQINFPATGAWQNWTTTNTTAKLNAGRHHLRIVITAPLFNINWLKFDLLNSIETLSNATVSLHPNPTKNKSYLKIADADYGNYDLKIYNNTGQLIYKRKVFVSGKLTLPLNFNGYSNGLYHLQLQNQRGDSWVEKLMKME